MESDLDTSSPGLASLLSKRIFVIPGTSLNLISSSTVLTLAGSLLPS